MKQKAQTLEKLRETLKAHLKKRPELPRPVPLATTPEYKGWLQALEKWIKRRSDLETAIAMRGGKVA